MQLMWWRLEIRQLCRRQYHKTYIPFWGNSRVNRSCRECVCRVVAFIITCLFMMLLSHTRLWHPDVNNVSPRIVNPHFTQALLKRADVNYTVILALADSAFLDMALNFYLSSLKPYGIDNYLFIGVSKKVCDHLTRLDIACYTYADDIDGETESEFNSLSFIRKTNLRTEMILDALVTGFTVIQTDVDVIFLRNPLPDLVNIDADIAGLWDYNTMNAGFLRIKPTKRSIWVYDQIRKEMSVGWAQNDQMALDSILSQCSLWRLCRLNVLNSEQYLNGMTYFEDGHHSFAGQNPCSKCIVVHNNFIVSKSAKIYRFKENHMWVNDENEYYSSHLIKYMTFSVSRNRQKITMEHLRTSLVNAFAIGRILGRIVILPQFSCADGHDLCALNSFYQLSSFDKQFARQYRESTFLSHPGVPKDVARSVSPVYRIRPQDGATHVQPESDSVTKYISSRDSYTVMSDEIMEWFKREHHRVLSIEYLHHINVQFTNPTENQHFLVTVQKAFLQCTYRQFC